MKSVKGKITVRKGEREKTYQLKDGCFLLARGLSYHICYYQTCLDIPLHPSEIRKANLFPELRKKIPRVDDQCNFV